MTKICYLKTHSVMFKRSMEAAKIHIINEVNNAINDGYTRFITGINGDLDIIFAKAVDSLKSEYPGIVLEVEIPKSKNLEKIDENIVFQKVFELCDAVVIGEAESLNRENGNTHIQESEAFPDIRYINF